MTTITNRVLTVYEDTLRACFDEWHKRHAADPDAFDAVTETNGPDCAEYLIELIDEYGENRATPGFAT